MNNMGDVEDTNDGEAQGHRLSTIRESMDSSLAGSVNSASFVSPAFVDCQNEQEGTKGALPLESQNHLSTNYELGISNQVQGSRRPNRLLSARPLSPISSSNETTPTDSPANRPRFLPFPNLLSKKLSKSFLLNNSSASTSTPSPMEPKPIFEAESPDELALVEAAYLYNCRLIKRSPLSMTVMMPGILLYV
jgi:hypothetical protein